MIFLSAVLVLILVLGLVLIGVLLLVVILVLILVTHNFFLQISFAVFRYNSLPDISRFILGFENQAHKKSCEDCNGDTACACL